MMIDFDRHTHISSTTTCGARDSLQPTRHIRVCPSPLYPDRTGLSFLVDVVSYNLRRRPAVRVFHGTGHSPSPQRKFKRPPPTKPPQTQKEIISRARFESSYKPRDTMPAYSACESYLRTVRAPKAQAIKREFLS